LEMLELERATVAQSCCTPRETSIVTDMAVPHPIGPFVLWSMREALAKTLRCGLTVPFSLLATENLECSHGSYRADFLNFTQYRAESWVLGRHILSIALPRHS